MKFAVKYLKNTFYPLEVPETIKLEDGQMVLVRTEKGEEALKAFLVNSKVAKIWRKQQKQTGASTGYKNTLPKRSSNS